MTELQTKPESGNPIPRATGPEFAPLLESTSLWASLRASIRARFAPPPPPLEIESKPVPVSEIWTPEDLKTRAGSRLGALLLHLLVIGILMLPIFHRQVGQAFHRVAVNITPMFLPATTPGKKRIGGGGGGGTHAIRPPSHGRLPLMLRHAKAPPMVVVHNIKPKLPVPPALVVQHVILPQPNLPQFGQPKIQLIVPSNGSGTLAGIGTGRGGGVGSGNGQGLGSGEGGNIGGGSYSEGAGITDPIAIYSPDPQFSNAAREAKYQGTVVLWVTIGVDGRAHKITVAKRLGLGLDQKAILAVKKWLFKPAMENGRPKAVRAQISISFHLF